MTPEEITKLAVEYAEEVTKDMAKTLDESSCLLNETKRATKEYITDFMQWLFRTHCIVGKEFVKRQRLVIEYDKKLMLEKPIGEKIALAGVYQAKLELMDNLFAPDTFDETDK